jgi:hypothetical protein
MHRNGKRIALSLVAIVLGAGFLLKVIPPETIIGDNDHHTASIDGLLITNPVDVNDSEAPVIFPPVVVPPVANLSSEPKKDSPLWIPGEPASEHSLSSPAVTHVVTSAPNSENPKSTVQDGGSDDKSQPGSESESPKTGGLPGPLLHEPKDSNGGSAGGGSGGGGSSQPGSPGSGSDNNNPPPQDGPQPPESGPNNPPSDDSAGDDDDDKPFPPEGPGDFPDENTGFPSNPGIPPGSPGGSDLPQTPHSVPDQGSSLALTFAGLVLLGAVKRSLRHK